MSFRFRCVLALFVLIGAWLVLPQATSENDRGATMPPATDHPAAKAAAIRLARGTQANHVDMPPKKAPNFVGDLTASVVGCIVARSDYAQAVHLISDFSGTENFDRNAVEVVTRLLARNPTWAQNLALALPEGHARALSADLVAGELARRSPDQALPWAKELPVGPTRSIALDRIVAELSASSLPDTAESIRRLTPSLAQDDALCSLAAQWAQHDVAGALDWVRDCPNDLLKSRLIASLGYEAAQRDGAAALRLARAKLTAADWSLLEASLRFAQAGTFPPRAPASSRPR